MTMDDLKALKAAANEAEQAYHGHKRPPFSAPLEAQIEFDQEETRLHGAHCAARAAYQAALKDFVP